MVAPYRTCVRLAAGRRARRRAAPGASFYRPPVAEPTPSSTPPPTPTATPSSTPPRLLALLVVLVTAGNALWLHRHRLGGPRDVDEAAYLGLAFYASNPAHRIVTTPWVLFPSTGYQAPLLPLTTGLLHDVLGRSVFVGYLTNLGFLALLLVATYALARRFTTGWWSLLAATVVATTPGIVDYTRHYHFAVPATATFTVALVALLRSERLTRRWWAVGFGVALAAVLLARTMMLAFAPGLVLAAVLAILAGPATDRRAGFRNLALALVIAVVGAGSWYAFSAPEVWDYLTGYGYGTESTGYGADSMTSLRFWLSDLVAVVSDGFYLPLALVLTAGAVVGLVTGPRVHGGWRARLHGEAVLVALPLALGFVALITSRNTGTGFVLPLLPGTVVLVVALLARARPPVLARVLAGALLAAGAVTVLTKAQVVGPFERQVSVQAAPWARLPVVDPSSIIDRYIATYTGTPNDERIDAWDDAVDELLVRTSASEGGTSTGLLTSVDGPMVNVPLLQLRAVLAGREDLRVTTVNRTTIDTDDPEVLAAWLGDLADDGYVNLLTGPERLDWPGVGLPESLTTEAADRAGYTRVDQVELPDGGQVTIWAAPRP